MAAVAGHHDNPSPAALLLAEKQRLVSSMVGLCPGPGSVHAATIAAVRDFLVRFTGDDAVIPWVRIYDAFPAWQQQSGLLEDQEWDRDGVMEKAMAILTLIDTKGPGIISRKALGGGTWKSTGALNIAHHLVLTKLYCKTPNYSFTGFEFRLTMNLQPRVAICVMYPTDYRHCVRDLRQYIQQTSYGHPLIRAPPPPPPFDAITLLLFSENNSMPESGGQYILMLNICQP